VETGDRIGLAVVEGVPDRMPERAAVLLLQINPFIHSFIHFVLAWCSALACGHISSSMRTHLVACGHIYSGMNDELIHEFMNSLITTVADDHLATNRMINYVSISVRTRYVLSRMFFLFLETTWQTY
jgi:hypothetical protein